MSGNDGNRNSVNNNYDQSYKQESGGEYSYRYTPKDTKNSRVGETIVRHIALGGALILLSIMIILPGFIFGALTIKDFFGSSDENSLETSAGDDSTGVDHGISTVDVTSKNLYYYSQHGIKSKGVIVTDSEYTDELKFGDKIISVNGTNISVSDDIERAVSNCAVGDEITLTVERGEEKLTICIILREQAEDYVDFE